MHVLPTLVEDLLDIVGRPYDGVDYVVLDDVRETMLDPGESNHPLAALGVVAQTPRDVAANIYLHTRLAQVDVAVTAHLVESRRGILLNDGEGIVHLRALRGGS